MKIYKRKKRAQPKMCQTFNSLQKCFQRFIFFASLERRFVTVFSEIWLNLIDMELS